MYNEYGSGRRENITDWALAQFRMVYGAGVTKRNIFHYVYAMLHHPQYRAKYAENLKRELPRIPLVGIATEHTERTENERTNTPSVSSVSSVAETFWRFAEIGAQLAELHLNYETAPEYPLK